MAKSKKRKRIKKNQRKRRKKMAAYIEGGGESNYARKRAYCHEHNVYGFEVKSPKPWKKAK